MTTQPGSAGTAGRNYKVEPRAGKHRAPPPPPKPPDAAWWTVAAAAGALIVASVIAVAVDVAPDARASGVHGTTVTVTTATSTSAGPLEMPTIGASGAWAPPEETTPSAPREHTVTASRGTRTTETAPEAATEPYRATTGPSAQTVTTTTQTVTTQQAATTTTAPPAATTTPDAPEETPTVTLPAATPTLTPRRTGRPR